VTGFLGGFTTFSTYMVDTDLLVRNRDVATALIYVAVSAAVGFAAVIGGIVTARLLIRLEQGLNEHLG
jgi:CrcB protein